LSVRCRSSDRIAAVSVAVRYAAASTATAKLADEIARPAPISDEPA
jgi:hypothetical protein